MKKILGFIVCTLLITTTGFSVIGIEEDNENELNENHMKCMLEYQSPTEGLFEWTMFRHNLNNTGFSPSLAPDDDTVLWSKDIAYTLESNPTIKDGRLYIAGSTLKRGGEIFCLNAFTGEEIWMTVQWDDEVWGSPTVANDKVYVLGVYHNLYCYDADTGDLLWDFESYGHCSPMIFDDKVYFGCSHGDKQGFYCLNATNGEEIWTHDHINSYSGCTPAIVDGKLYIASDELVLYSLDALTGSVIWSAPHRGNWGSPAFYEDKIYIGYDKLYCINADTGEDEWSVELTVPPTHCSPAVAYGNVYIDGGYTYPEGDGRIYCYDADTGDWIWTSPLLGNSIWNGFAVADGKLYTCSNKPGKFNCLDAFTGDIIWQFNFSSTGSYSSPAVAYGNVYVGSSDGYIHAFGTNQPPEKPISPNGPSEGFIGVEYTFNSSTNDPDGYELYYLYDWGDGTFSDWLGPYKSGEYVEAVHTWENIGVYNIRVKAKDEYNSESNWSEPHNITIMNRPILEIGQISGGLLKVKADIKNIGDIDANDVNWSITLKGGTFIGKKTEGTDLNVIAGESETITSKLIFGFGPTVITVNAWITESSDKREQTGFVLLFFIKVNPGG